MIEKKKSLIEQFWTRQDQHITHGRFIQTGNLEKPLVIKRDFRVNKMADEEAARVSDRVLTVVHDGWLLLMKKSATKRKDVGLEAQIFCMLQTL